VIAAGAAVVAPGGVLRRARSAPPLTIRQVLADESDVCALCLVGSAAGPLAGDSIDLDLAIEDGARATLSSAGATLAQGRSGGASSAVRTRATLGEGAFLAARCEPLVVCGGSQVSVAVRLDLARSATVVWREVVVLGREGERPGAATLDWDVRRGGRPLLRQRTDLTADPLWAGLLRGRRVLASELRVGPGVRAATLVHSDTAVAQRVADEAVLTTVLATDAASALAELAALGR
jgi:urease accessory protein